MPVIFRKYFTRCLLTLVPIFLISNANVNKQQKERDFNTIETFNHELFVKMRFSVGTEMAVDGTNFSTLKLHIENENKLSEDSLEFIISREKSLGKIGPGNYKIAKDKDGLLNYVDGVFGFLDKKDSGELPFFAHFGEITITELDEELVNGFLNIAFENTIGESIEIKSDFVALR